MWSQLFAWHISKRTSISSPTWDNISGVGLISFHRKDNSSPNVNLHPKLFSKYTNFYISLKKTSNYVMSGLQYTKQWTVKHYGYALKHTKHWFLGSHVDVQQICGVAVSSEFCNCAVYCANNVECCLVN